MFNKLKEERKIMLKKRQVYKELREVERLKKAWLLANLELEECLRKLRQITN